MKKTGRRISYGGLLFLGYKQKQRQLLKHANVSIVAVGYYNFYGLKVFKSDY